MFITTLKNLVVFLIYFQVNHLKIQLKGQWKIMFQMLCLKSADNLSKTAKIAIF